MVGGRAAQDTLVSNIQALFPDAQVIDRREIPSHGYRAVHVIATVDRRPVEIQVRTVLQDLWAQVLERVADRFGREIRYGQVPEDPGLVLGGTTVQEFVAEWIRISDRIRDLDAGDRVSEGLLHTFRELLAALDMGG